MPLRLMVLLCALLLNSCIEMRVLVQVHADGSADVEKRFGMSQEIAKMSQGNTSNVRDSSNFAKEGFAVRSYSEGGFTGVVGKLHLDQLGQLSQLLNFNSDSLKSKQGGSPALRVEKGWFINRYIMDSHLDLRAGHGSTDPTMLSAMMSSARMEFSLELPSAPLHHNATQVSQDGKSLTWKFELGKDNLFQLEARSYNWLNIALTLGLALLILASLSTWLLRRRQS